MQYCAVRYRPRPMYPQLCIPVPIDLDQQHCISSCLFTFVHRLSPPFLLFPSPFLHHVLTFITLIYSEMARDRLAAMRVRLPTTGFFFFSNELGEGSAKPREPIVGERTGYRRTFTQLFSETLTRHRCRAEVIKPSGTTHIIREIMIPTKCLM